MPIGVSDGTLILQAERTRGTRRYEVWGIDIDRAPRDARAAIGVVPQELNIDPFFTPLESLEVQAGLYAVPRIERRSMEILDRVGLAEHAHAEHEVEAHGRQRGEAGTRASCLRSRWPNTAAAQKSSAGRKCRGSRLTAV